MKLVPALVGLCWSWHLIAEPQTPVFSKGSNCVAWKAKETMFLFKDSQPVGMNCQIGADFVHDGKQAFFRGSFPLKSFKSDDSTRDKDLVGMLHGDKQPELVFVSEKLPVKQWQTLISEGSGNIRGQLKIGGKNFPLTCPVVFDKAGDDLMIMGFVKTSFTELDLEVPSVLGGIVASIEDYLELHYHLRVAEHGLQ